MRCAIYIVFCAVLAPAGHAQENCPAAINSGTWDTWLAGTGTGRVTGGNFLNFVQSQPASARGEANIDASACDGSFILQMPNHRFIMEATDPDSAGSGQEFTGNINAQGMNWSMTLQRLSDSQLAGGFEAATAAGGISISVGVTGLGVQYQPNLAELPLICHCRAHLESFIEEKLRSNRTYRDAYATEAWRQRPPSWPQQDPMLEIWYVKTYNRIIDLVVLGHTYQQAVDRVWENSDTAGNPEEPDYIPPSQGGAGAAATSEQGSGEVEYESVQMAFVDDQCQLHLGDAYLDSCYPEIEREGTLIHEGVHVADCQAGLQSGNIANHAAQEVRAYEAEIAWLEDWLPQNCGG